MAEIDEDLKKWRGRLASAKFYQDNFGNTDDRWDKFSKALASDFGSKEKSRTGEYIDVNLVHGTTQLRLAPLYTSEPFISIRPTTEIATIGGVMVDNSERARYTEAEINYWVRELRLREQVIRPVVHDIETTNHGYIYVGYVREQDKLFVESNDEMRGRVEPNPLIKVGSPFARRLSPRQVLVPPTGVEFEDHPWIAIGWRRPVDVVKAQFPGNDGLKPTIDTISKEFAREKNASHELMEHLDSDDGKLVQLWQIWDKWTGKLITVADDHDKFLEDPADWPYQTEGFPVAHADFVLVPDEFWGTPSMQMYWPQQVELNAARTAAKQRNNRTKAVVFMRSDVAEEIRKKYADAEDGEVIAVPIDDGEDIRRAIMIDPGLPTPSQAYADGQIQVNDILFTSGLGGQQRGVADPGVGTATESANVEKWGLVRATAIGDRTRSLYLDVAKKLWMVLKQNKDVKRDRLIVGPLGAEVLQLKYSLGELEGEFAWQLDVGSMIADSPLRRQQLALANYNLLRADPEVDGQRLTLDLLDSQGKPNPMAYLGGMRDPQEEASIMAQGIPVEAKLRDNHEMHRAMHDQQTQQLSQQLDQMDPRGVDGEKLRLAMALMMAHRNQHNMLIQQITGKPPEGGAGTPQDENLLRNEAVGGVETDAEQGGQPLTGGSAESGGRGAPNAGGVASIAGR